MKLVKTSSSVQAMQLWLILSDIRWVRVVTEYFIRIITLQYLINMISPSEQFLKIGYQTEVFLNRYTKTYNSLQAVVYTLKLMIRSLDVNYILMVEHGRGGL